MHWGYIASHTFSERNTNVSHLEPWRAACQMARTASCLREGICSQKWTSQLPLFRACLLKGKSEHLFGKDCAYPASLIYTASWCIFCIPKFSNRRYGIISLGSHLELNTDKTDSKYFNINWEMDHHMNTITNNQTYSFCVARNGSCRVRGRKLRLFLGPSRALMRTARLHLRVCNKEARQLATQVKSPNDNVVHRI